MAGITTSGLGSGIDIRALVEQLVAAERAPVQNRLDRQQYSVQSQLSAYGTLKSALSSFRDQVRELAKLDNFGLMRASSSNGDAVAINASSSARVGSYQIEVQALAQAQSVASAGFAEGAVLAGGTLTFRFGTLTPGEEMAFEPNPALGIKTVEIAPGSTLQQIRDAVNAAKIGVQAAVINDGQQDRLVFTADKTGAANGFVIEADPGLAALAFDGSGNGQAELTRAAADAEVIINGLRITRSQNTISDAIEGVTLTLKDTTTGSVRLDISQDKAAVAGKIKSFVESYNKLQQQITQLTRYDAENQRASVLTGNALVRTLNSSLRNLLTSPVAVLEGSGIRALADLGIITKMDGTLELDNARLDKAIESNFEQIGSLFAAMGLTAEAEGVEFVGSSKDTRAGVYAVEITQAATQGRYLAAPLPSLEGEQGGSFTLKLDGVTSNTIALPRRSYADGAELAAVLQAQINSDAKLRDAGLSVSVEFRDGRLEIVSSRYGSESTVEILTADADFRALGFEVGEGEAGLDVAGTIGGLPATGNGQILTGTGAAEGLQLRISGTGLGSRGTVTFSRGILDDIDSLLSDYLDSDGILNSTTKSLDAQLKDIDKRREALDARMESVHARLLSQFIAMDALLAQMNQTSSFLAQQLAGLERMINA